MVGPWGSAEVFSVMCQPNRSPSTRRPTRTPRLKSRAALVVAIAALGLGGGCGREFFRNWADQDVSEAVFEKSRDPRWKLDTFSIEPPALSRFANPYDPDRPPAPPDDFATEALSPVPQWPHHRLMVPSEGTGYLDMMETWRNLDPVANAGAAEAPAPAGPTPTPTPLPPGTPAPFSPTPGAATTAPPTAASRPSGAISGPTIARATPKTPTRAQTDRGHPGLVTLRPATSPKTPARPSSAQPPKDPAVQVAALRQADTPPPIPRPAPETPVAGQPDQGPADVPVGDRPTTIEPVRPDSMDPDPINLDLKRRSDPRPDLTPGEAREAEGETSELAAVLVPGALSFDEAEAAGLPKDVRPYVLKPDQAVTLALINNRPYQYRLENLYIAALAVTLQRFNFTPQVYAGLTPVTGPAGTGIPSPNPANSFLYRTQHAPGGQASILTQGEVAGVGKLFSNGARVLGGFANQLVFNFTGRNVRQPSVQSTLPLAITLPFLSGGGRAVTLEQLTLAERQLLYEVRSFARFRQEFIPYVLLDVQAIDNPGIDSGSGVGYLNVLQQLQAVEIDRRNVAKFEQALKVFSELASGAGSDLTQLQVDQVYQSLLSARQTLITDTLNYRLLLDQYKIQLGLPPDTPMVLDRGLTLPFREVFDRIDKWSVKANRDLDDLEGFLDGLPQFEDIPLEGHSLRAILDKDYQEHVDRLNDFLLSAERVSLENRLDLMNARAQLYDLWRQLAVTANQLLGVFNVSVSNQIFTPPTTTNPFGFFDQSKQFSLVLNSELPLIRLAQRNTYISAQINYKRQQRTLMLTEDSIKLNIRQLVRQLVQTTQTYEIQKKNFLVTLRVVDQSQEQLVAPTAGGAQGGGGNSQVSAQTINFVNNQRQIPTTQNQLVQSWVNYETFRLALYRDLGLMPYEEWEAYHGLFPTKPSEQPNLPPAGAPDVDPAVGPNAPNADPGGNGNGNGNGNGAARAPAAAAGPGAPAGPRPARAA